jgi:hypothetical protein
MTDEDRPPEHMWLDEEALQAHWERVKARYSSQASGGSADMEAIPTLDQNELTKDLRRR